MLRKKIYKLVSLFMCLILKMVVTDKVKWQKKTKTEIGFDSAFFTSKTAGRSQGAQRLLCKKYCSTSDWRSDWVNMFLHLCQDEVLEWTTCCW